MTQQLLSAGNGVCQDSPQTGFTPVGSAAAAAGFTPAGAAAVGFTPVGSATRALSADEVLAALPASASAALREAIAAGCCIHYTVSEGDCGSGGCGSGSCCYHVVGSACGINEYECIGFPCSHGNYSTGC